MSTDIIKKYNPAIDLLRILAIISVLLIHTSTKVLALSNLDFTNHYFSFFINEATRFAVPIFFLISAFLLELTYPIDFKYSTYIKQRFTRLFLPYLFWSLIYFFVIYPGGNNFPLALLSGGASYQLYFIPSLFIFYLFFPLMHNCLKYLKNKYVLISLTILQLLLLANDYYLKPLVLPQPIGVFILNFDVFIIGILACHYQNKILEFVKKYQNIFLFINIIIAIAITVEAWNLYKLTGNYLFFYSNWRPLAFIYTLTLSSYLYYLFSRVSFNPDIIKKTASYSFFVYFIHIIFIEMTWKYLPHAIFGNLFILFLFVLIPSYFLAFISSKIPHLSKLTG